jgi:hypothetical protein
MKNRIGMVAAAALFVASACNETSVSPTSLPPGPVQGSPALKALGTSEWTKSFTISPTGSSVNLFGVYTVRFPANSVCNPAITTACVPATAPINVTVTVKAAHGRLWADFSPHLEFVNSADPTRWVTISTDILSGFLQSNRDYLRANPGYLRRFALLYASSIGAPPVSQAGSDPTLKTWVNYTTGVIWRRIKSFSGYNVATGEPCDPSPEDPYCIDVPDDEEPPEEGEGPPQ